MEWFREAIGLMIAGMGPYNSDVLFSIGMVAIHLVTASIVNLSGFYTPIISECSGILQTTAITNIPTGYILHFLYRQFNASVSGLAPEGLHQYGFTKLNLTLYGSVLGMILFGIPDFNEWSDQIRTFSKAVYIGIISFVAIIGWSIVLQSIVNIVSITLGPLRLQLLNTLSLGLGGMTITGWYLYISNNSLSYLDVSAPITPREIGYTIGGIVVLFGLLKGTEFLLTYFTIPIAEHGIATQARQGNPAILLILIPAAWLIIGPIEEILYRNIIQKLLYSAFSRGQAIGLASIIFALSHIPAYLGSGLLALTSTLILLLVLSTVLGIVYERTQNIVPSAIVHGSYDGILFIMLYVRLT
ncbi:MAG: lysostaphin resistance A-like protein [Halobacteriaceae archaeon]